MKILDKQKVSTYHVKKAIGTYISYILRYGQGCVVRRCVKYCECGKFWKIRSERSFWFWVQRVCGHGFFEDAKVRIFEKIRCIWNKGASAECVRSENDHKALNIDRDVWNNLLKNFVFLGCQIKASWAHIERKTHSTSHFLPIPCQFGVSLQGKNILIEIRLCGIFTFEKRAFISEFDICFHM